MPKEREVGLSRDGTRAGGAGVPGDEPSQKISIIPRGIAALGYTMQRPTEDRFLMSRQELERLSVLLGGRAAEIIGDDVSTGAADDLAKATDIARSMVLVSAWIQSSGWSRGTRTRAASFCSSNQAHSGDSAASAKKPLGKSTNR